MKQKCTNTHMVSQCKMMLSSIEMFRSGMEMAANKDNDRIDRSEERMMKDIGKQLDKLKATINDYV